MKEFLNQYAVLLFEGTFDTLYMVFFATIFSYILGLPMGIALYVTQKNSILENTAFNKIFGWIVNILRSIPFIILIITVMPVTRAIVGKAIGPTAAIIPLVIGSAPFVARMVESSLEEIDKGVIEACECMGATAFEIITKVLIQEALPSIIRGFSITAITLIAYSAMAGAVGAGGLGDIAIRYGYHRKIQNVMYISVVLVVILVCIIQSVFGLIGKKVDKKCR
ncbi:MAG: methionine ABC transporter permease [Oscillospiraceae bacterium]